MDPASSIFSYCVGGLALISTFGSILCYCRLYLPTTQLRLLNDVLVETKDIYRKASDERLLPPEVSRDAQIRLNLYEDESDRLREITYQAMSCIDTLRALFKGHTRQIMRLAKDVGKLRAFLMTTSQREKARRTKASRQRQSVLCSEFGEASDMATAESTQCSNGVEGQYDRGCSSRSDSLARPVSDLPRIDRLADDAVLSEPATIIHPPALSGHNRISTCLVCSFLGWCSRKSSRTESTLPSFVVRETARELLSSSTSASSGTSTLVDEPAHKSLSFPPVRLPVSSWTFGRADSVQEPGCDINLHPCDDSTTAPPAV